ncbi:bZIP transcription factor domain containing protein [Musa troglodytarum]|uniref:BZIP transcription factor domain containing protein n=1 Tax=Musa troglodytarum TaxID=320322 RepID=A0A9E7HGN1_9LILI|nr:bZIP transcription factor domain containing protein [Musa troglodytarum]
MANMRAAANMRSSAPGGKQSFLPPRCPLPTVSPSYADYGSIGPRGIPRPKEGQRHHQRTSSESFLIEEQPLWLDDLLNEPETPARRGAHRRSTSDSFAYLDGVSLSNIGSVGQEQQSFRALSPWMSQELNHHKDVGHFSYYPEANSSGRPQLKVWESAADVVSYPGSTLLANDKTIHPQPSSVQTESDGLNPDVVEKNEHLDGAQDKKGPFEKKEDSHSKQTEVDSKRVKQIQFHDITNVPSADLLPHLSFHCRIPLFTATFLIDIAAGNLTISQLRSNSLGKTIPKLESHPTTRQYAQRSRVRKLQYIAELEKHAEGLEVFAELEFLDQQNLILNLENKALKQRLDSLAQEKLIKRLQQETLEREIARLRTLYQQQQQQQRFQEQPHPTHARRSSRDLDSQFANLSLKHKDKTSGCESVTACIKLISAIYGLLFLTKLALKSQPTL